MERGRSRERGRGEEREAGVEREGRREREEWRGRGREKQIHSSTVFKQSVGRSVAKLHHHRQSVLGARTIIIHSRM